MAPSLRSRLRATQGDVDVTMASNPESLDPRPYIWSGPQISEARSLDRNCYVSSDFFRAEVEHIHARGWIIVGRTDEWPTAGCYRAVETVGGPVLIVRDEEGELRAFANFSCAPRWKRPAASTRA